jgi:EAL domain-containing protein (putative c-di-GMP-specific phosphodiesterase class I)
MVQLGQTLDLTATAERVETPDQLRALLRMGRDRAQGFWIGYPSSFN